ncbi:MAG: hypothetical protein B9S26_09410 [Opitutia bacterium Tous-C4FEB]|jgi:hypothetical protein|nr:MAG: hypothetical protein B9S35_11495 [Opitutae bacterium Tous-C5TDCM]PAW89045.1 MAG: hypothetical protein B9S26_09410 [Opitutae bacterium Tous-C4FEB]
MNYGAEYIISEFTNPSGEVIFHASGWLDGKRIRKNFASHTEAATKAAFSKMPRWVVKPAASA